MGLRRDIDGAFDAVVDLYDRHGNLLRTVATRVDVVSGMAITRCHDPRATYAVVRASYQIDSEGLPVIEE